MGHFATDENRAAINAMRIGDRDCSERLPTEGTWSDETGMEMITETSRVPILPGCRGNPTLVPVLINRCYGALISFSFFFFHFVSSRAERFFVTRHG